MSATDLTRSALVEWGVAGRAIPGQTILGDLSLVKSFGQNALAAVVDGLGHGLEAFAVAEQAVNLLEANAALPPDSLIQRCHEGLLKSRGAVMSLVVFDAVKGCISGLGVGNVDGCLFRADATVTPSRESILLTPGIVGSQFPPLRASVFTVSPGDLFILTSDGVRGGFEQDINIRDDPRAIADRIIARYFKGSDDALALVVRYLGTSHE